MGLGLKQSHNLFIYVGTGKDSSQWEIQRERTSKRDGRVRIMPETHMQTKKLDWILKGDFVPSAYTCNNREVGFSQGFFLSFSNFSERHLL